MMMRVKVQFSKVYQEAAQDILKRSVTSEYLLQAPDCEYALQYTVPSEIALELFAKTENAGPLWDHREDVRKARALGLGPRQALLMALADAIIRQTSEVPEEVWGIRPVKVEE